MAVTLLGACTSGGRSPDIVLDGLGWPDSSAEVVFVSDQPDPSCGSVSCPTAVRYLQVESSAPTACEGLAVSLGAEAGSTGGGCLVTSCVDGHLVNGNVNERTQPVFEPGGPSRVDAPVGGVAVALRAREGC